MRESGQENWWRRTNELAAATLGGAIVFLLVPWLLSFALAGRTAFGLPLAYFIFAVLAPVAIMAAIFWFSRRQQGLDHRYDVTGNRD